jgi:DNA primase
VELSQEYLIELFFTHCKRPIHKKYNNIYNAECPVCKEGKSAGRSRRLFYFPSKQYFYCHNCCRSWRTLDWVKEVTNLTVTEILKQNRLKTQEIPAKVKKFKSQIINQELPDLPENSIDITDEFQYDFFKENKFIRLAKDYCEQRRLFTAINSCKKFFVSIEDKIHKNRLIIPFFDQNNKIISYQTRALTNNQFPRYLTKFGEKGVFNIANIQSSIPYVFVFEGPIDSMFVQNGVAIAALSPTQKQQAMLQNLIGYQIIYVFDNDKNNIQTAKKIQKHVKDNKRIFIWPKELQKYKDFNEICCQLQYDEIPWQFIVKHSAKGIEAEVKTKLSI